MSEYTGSAKLHGLVISLLRRTGVDLTEAYVATRMHDTGYPGLITGHLDVSLNLQDKKKQKKIENALELLGMEDRTPKKEESHDLQYRYLDIEHAMARNAFDKINAYLKRTQAITVENNQQDELNNIYFLDDRGTMFVNYDGQNRLQVLICADEKTIEHGIKGIEKNVGKFSVTEPVAQQRSSLNTVVEVMLRQMKEVA